MTKELVPTFEGRLYTDSECHGIAGNWVRRAEIDVLLDENTRLRGNLTLAEEGLASAMQEIQTLQAGRENAQLINDNGAKEIERLRVRINGYADTNVKLRAQLIALGVNPFNEIGSNTERQQSRDTLEPPDGGWIKCECAGCPGLIPPASREPPVQHCDCWERISTLIVTGPLEGNGWDPTAQRNGIILAANFIAPHNRSGKVTEPASREAASHVHLYHESPTAGSPCTICGEPYAVKSGDGE